MAAFAVISTASNDALGKHVADTYPDMFLALSNSAWFVADQNKTTQEVCEKLNIKSGGFTNAVVVKVDTYFGFASPTIWEWLKVKGVGP